MPDLLITDDLLERCAVAALVADAAMYLGPWEGLHEATKAAYREIARAVLVEALTHTCPSWRASGERCTTFCADCGGRGWAR